MDPRKVSLHIRLTHLYGSNMNRRLGAVIVAIALTTASCSSSSTDSKESDQQLKGAPAGPVAGGSSKTTIPVKIPTPTASKKPMTLCTSTWNPFDPTTPVGTKNLLAYAAYKSIPSMASATLSIDDAKVSEATSSATLTVTVKITNPQKQELHLQFGWAAYNNTAVESSDFVKSNGAVDVTVTGAQAQLTSLTRTYPIKVSLINDQLPEVDDMWRQVTEDMNVRIGVCPSPAIKILKDTANVVITEDDTVFDALGSTNNERELIDGYLLAVAAEEVYASKAYENASLANYISGYLGDLYAKRGTPIVYSNSSPFSDEVIVFTTSKAVVVDFRGSQQTQDFLTDLRVDFTGTGASSLKYGPELAHIGFWEAVDHQYSGLIAAVRSAMTGGKKVYVTGHSLGAAMATIFAFRAQKDGINIEKVSTIGSPRAFNGNAALDYYDMGLGTRTTRWIFDDDVVTHIPSEGALIALCTLAMLTVPAFGTTVCASAAGVFIGLTDDYRHVGLVRRFEADFGGDNCVNFHLAMPEDLWGPPTYKINDYESTLISVNDHSTYRYINGFWRSMSPTAQALVKPAPNDPRFVCEGTL